MIQGLRRYLEQYLKPRNYEGNSNSHNMSNEHTVTACLVSFAQQNGFVDVQLNEGQLTQQNLFSAGRKFFRPEAQLKGARIAYSNGGESEGEPFDMIVLYDQGLHGKGACPYLAFKSINRSAIINVSRGDYMEVMRAVEL